MKEMVASGRDADEKGEKITGRKLEAPDNGHPPVAVDDTRTQKRKLPQEIREREKGGRSWKSLFSYLVFPFSP